MPVCSRLDPNHSTHSIPHAHIVWGLAVQPAAQPGLPLVCSRSRRGCLLFHLCVSVSALHSVCGGLDGTYTNQRCLLAVSSTRDLCKCHSQDGWVSDAPCVTKKKIVAHLVMTDICTSELQLIVELQTCKSTGVNSSPGSSCKAALCSPGFMQIIVTPAGAHAAGWCVVVFFLYVMYSLLRCCT